MSPSYPGLVSSDPFQRFLLSQSLEVMDDLAAIVDLEGRLTYANPAAGRLLGCRQEHLTGRFLWDIIPDCSRIADLMRSALEMGQWRGEVMASVRGCEPIPVRLRAVLVQTKGGEVLGIVVMGWDLRPEKRMESQLLRYERQRLLGEMASGMAHNFNNILVGIRGHAQMLGQDASLSEDARRSVQVVIESAERAAELVDRLQRSANGEADAPEIAVNLDGVIRSCVTATEPRWRHQPQTEGRPIEIELDLDAKQTIDARRSSIDEVVTNFVFNAVDAMPDGGKILIRSWDEGDSVCFSVRDSGVGMDRDTRRRLGELFFTTKGERGHGLGLAFCYRVVGQMGGFIEVESAPGEGTAFTVRLPGGRMAPEESLDTPSAGETVSETPRGRARVLVAEDEAQIRDLVRVSLEGHTVDAVGDGLAAIGTFRAGLYDLVLLDLSMPGLNGMELAARIRQLDPDVALVLLTGWEPADVAGHQVFDRVIRKPFTLDDLRRQVEEVLAGG